MWQDGSEFMRPKWGIYRSSKLKEDLKDEVVLFNSFSINEIETLALENLEKQADQKQLIADAKKGIVNFKNSKAKDYDNIELYDGDAKIISTKKILKKYKIDLSKFSTGNYYIVFNKNKRPVKVLKCVVE